MIVKLAGSDPEADFDLFLFYCMSITMSRHAGEWRALPEGTGHWVVWPGC